MSQEITTTQPKRLGALASMSSRYNVDPAKLLTTLKNTVFKNATEDQLMALCIVANEYDLNPFVKEIYAFPAKGGGIVPVISIDGWLKRINTHPQYDGMDFEYEMEGKTPHSCTVTIWRKDLGHPVKLTEFYDECYRKTEPWDTCPRRMLRHKAIIQCARVAFGFAGHDPEDGEIIHERQATGRTVSAPALPLPVKEEAAMEPEKATAIFWRKCSELEMEADKISEALRIAEIPEPVSERHADQLISSNGWKMFMAHYNGLTEKEDA